MKRSIRRLVTVGVGVTALAAGAICVGTAALSSPRQASSTPTASSESKASDLRRHALRKMILAQAKAGRMEVHRAASRSAKAEAAVAEQSLSRQEQIAKGCGPDLMWKTTGTLWTCSFADNFTGTALDRTKWIPSETSTHGYRSGEECMVDSPNNIRVLNGAVRITVRKERSPFLCRSPYGDFETSYTGASISTYAKFAQAFGRFEIRAKFPDTKVAGVHSALWLYPQDTTYGAWPHSGEIDIAEFYSAYPDRAIPYIHYSQSAYDPSVTNNYCMLAMPDEFHTYVAEWTAERIKISFDGVTCVDHKIDPAAPLEGAAPFDNPFFVVLTQALGVTKNAFDAGSTPLPATTVVDYVRVWS